LHRLFIMRHGWHIKGFGRDADTTNVASPVGVLKDHVPSYIQSLFEKQLGEKGLGLRELSVMASTMEHLIHQEVTGKLALVYNLMNMLPTESVGEEHAHEILDTYMMGFILGLNMSSTTRRTTQAYARRMDELYSGWNSTQTFVRDVYKKVTSDSQKGTPQHMNFGALSKVLGVIGEEFGTFQQTDCNELKSSLMKLEYRSTGRVRLGDFYNGHWQFKESTGYLRQLGALDESDPKNPSVVIPNYVHSYSNCIAPSGFYAVCCKDECESLVGHLEEKIAADAATPAHIAAVVQNLPSATVASPRQLSTTLLQRLDDIAAKHGGEVPLHGRLFAQWMHHAYPRECLYPHLSGTTSQQTPQEWAYDNGRDSQASDEEIQRFTSSESNSDAPEDNDEQCLPWTHEEELLGARQETKKMFTGFRVVVLLASVISLALSLLHTSQTMSAGGKGKRGIII